MRKAPLPIHKYWMSLSKYCAPITGFVFSYGTMALQSQKPAGEEAHVSASFVLEDVATNGAECTISTDDYVKLLSDSALESGFHFAILLHDLYDLLVGVQDLGRQRREELAKKRGTVDDRPRVATTQVEDRITSL